MFVLGGFPLALVIARKYREHLVRNTVGVGVIYFFRESVTPPLMLYGGAV